MNQDTLNKQYTIQSIQKAIQVLNAFNKNERRLSLTDFHRKTGIGISSLQRIIATLVNEGFLYKDERTKYYQLGLPLFVLGKLVEQDSSLLTVAKPLLAQLNQKIGESISLNVIDGYERRCLFNLESKYSLSTRAYVGDTAPLYAGASAKSLLAYLPEEEIRAYLKRVNLTPITNKTIIDKEVLFDNLAEIRQKGYAFSQSECVLGVASISAPILLTNGRPLASITVVIPEARFSIYNQAELIQEIKKAAVQIEQQLF